MERVKGFSVLRSWPAALDDFRNWLISARRPLSLGVNRLTALEHLYKARDLLLPSGYCIRVVHSVSDSAPTDSQAILDFHANAKS